MAKTEVYSWRVATDLKQSLEHAARDEGISMSRLLDRIAYEFLRRDPGDSRQEALREAALATFGSIRGGDPDRSARAAETIRARLRQRHGC